MNFTPTMLSFIIDVPPRQIRHLCQMGKIKAFKDSKGWLIPEKEIVRLKKEQKIPKAEFYRAVERVKCRLYDTGVKCPPDCHIDNCLDVGECLYARTKQT